MSRDIPARGVDSPDASNFTGRVQATILRGPDAESALTMYDVSFEVGARTHWHTHPLGQALYVTAGQARVQIGNEPARDYGPGSYVWIPPRTRHWHGATPNVPMTHLAVQEAAPGGDTAHWCEPVPDQTYLGQPRGKEHD